MGDIINIPPQFVLTPEENEIMDLIVNHIVDFFISKPKEFLRPVLGTQRPLKELKESNILKKEKDEEFKK